MAEPKLQVIGGGKMGEALIAGLVDQGWASVDELRVVEVVPARAAELTARYEGLTVLAAPAAAAGHVIAVKPADVESACHALAQVGAAGGGAGAGGAEGSGAVEGGAAAGGAAAGAEAGAPAAGGAGAGAGASGAEAGAPAPVLSIAAGITIARLEAALAPGTPVVRAMPNTPALVGTGASAIAAGSAAGDADLVWAQGVLGAVGVVEVVPESLLDAVTGLSGSGPAYVFLVAEALVEAGVLAGLPRATAARLAHQTLLGSARMLAESADGPEALRAAVTSPGGTTAAGLRELERAGVRAAFLDAVMAATERSRELGRAGG
jgi:pyrroline-5-carboxylate reductase